MQRGLLAISNPKFTKIWGFGDEISKLYNLPIEKIDQTISHDHLPHHDAYTIACELHIMHGIKNGSIKLKRK